MLINPIFRPGIAHLDVHPTTMTTGLEQLTGYAKVLFDNQPIQKGDILIIISFPGAMRSISKWQNSPRERGIVVIGSHPENTPQELRPDTPSGKKMYQFGRCCH